MPQYRITAVGPRGGKGHQVSLWAERACDALADAVQVRPEFVGLWLDVCRVRSRWEQPQRGWTGFQYRNGTRKAKR